jgi:hypothetical protein
LSTFFNSVDVFFVIFNLGIIFLEGFRVYLDLLEGLATNEELREHLKIVTTVELTHVDELEEVTLVPVGESFIKIIVLQLLVLGCELWKYGVFELFFLFFTQSIIFDPFCFFFL